jgi:hypothetical protein
MIVKDYFLDEVFEESMNKFKPEPLQLDGIKILQKRQVLDKIVYQDTVSLKDIYETIDPKYGNVKETNDKSQNELWMLGECEDPIFGSVKDNIIKKSKFFMIDYDNRIYDTTI